MDADEIILRMARELEQFGPMTIEQKAALMDLRRAFHVIPIPEPKN
jgi:hypothetical protein